jgi:hypothetical protein
VSTVIQALQLSALYLRLGASSGHVEVLESVSYLLTMLQFPRAE